MDLSELWVCSNEHDFKFCYPYLEKYAIKYAIKSLRCSILIFSYSEV